MTDETSEASQQSKPSADASSWSTDGWSSWSVSSWDTGPNTSLSETTSTTKESETKSLITKSPKEDKSFTESTSPASSKLLKFNRKTSESVTKPNLTRKKSSEKIRKSLEKENVELPSKKTAADEKDTESAVCVANITKSSSDNIDEKDKMEESKNRDSEESHETSSDISVQGNKSLLEVKCNTGTDLSLDSSSPVLTGSNTGSYDRLSPLSVGSGEIISSYEKIQNLEKSTAEDVMSLHSTTSSNEMTDSLNVGSDNSITSGKNSNTEFVSSAEKTLLCDSEESEVCEMLPTNSVILGDVTSLQESVGKKNVETPSNVSSQMEQTDFENEPSHFVESHFGHSGNMDETSQIIHSHTEQLNSPNELGNLVESHVVQSSEDKAKTELVCDVKLTDFTNQDNIGDISCTDTSLLDQCESSVSSVQVKSDNVSPDEEVVQSKSNTKVPDIENVSVKTSGIASDSENNTSPLSPGIHHFRSNSSGSHDDQPSSPLTTSSSGEGSKLDSSMDTDDTVVDRSTKADSDSMESVSPSSSYVKCMIEEAMDDNVKIEDNSSDGYSVGKSECSRSTGGQESGDEVDTTTSSDIEIISTPTSNGESNKFIDLSPLKIALQKTARRNDGSHRRNDSHDSQSSSSSQSRDGHGEQMSPGRDTDSSEDGIEMKITSEEASKYMYLLYRTIIYNLSK